MIKIKFLKDYGKHAKGEVMEVEPLMADKLVKDEVAELSTDEVKAVKPRKPRKPRKSIMAKILKK